MKRISVFVIAASFLATPVQASEHTNGETSTPAVFTAANPVALGLARELVSLIYPVSDTIDAMRTGWMESLDSIESVSMRAFAKQEYQRSLDRLEPVIAKHFPAIQEAYADVYAQEFSPSELEELIAFARTPTGRHFLSDTEFADYSDSVLNANDAMSTEIEPIMLDLQKAMCAQKTQERIARGETDAKCSMA